MKTTFENNLQLIDAPISDQDRKSVMDDLGEKASQYRDQIYDNGFSGEKHELTLMK